MSDKPCFQHCLSRIWWTSGDASDWAIDVSHCQLSWTTERTGPGSQHVQRWWCYSLWNSSSGLPHSSMLEHTEKEMLLWPAESNGGQFQQVSPLLSILTTTSVMYMYRSLSCMTFQWHHVMAMAMWFNCATELEVKPVAIQLCVQGLQ